jgi:hypothetical protein
MEIAMNSITNFLKGAGAAALALSLAAMTASAEPKKKLPADVRIVPKYMVIHGPALPAPQPKVPLTFHVLPLRLN